jgi:hypothetical protein
MTVKLLQTALADLIAFRTQPSLELVENMKKKNKKKRKKKKKKKKKMTRHGQLFVPGCFDRRPDSDSTW